MSFHGEPCWFELSTARGKLPAAEEFYEKLLGWRFADSGMPDFSYHLGSSDGDAVAGVMETPEHLDGIPPNWLVYIAVDSADAVADKVRAKGGRILHEPADIPGTGRFAVASDPQGAAFGILQPEPMDPPMSPDCKAWNQKRAGRGNWIELMSTDPAAGFEFYSDLFGWTRSTAMDMGEMGTYQLFRHGEAEIGGMMGLGNSPVSNWLPYFGVDDVARAIDTVKAGGGTLIHGPAEVPGPALIAVAQDPQGAYFAVVGPKPDSAR